VKAGPSASGDRYRVIAEINMIPLIDVSLVLLIIFMVLTPMLVRSQVQINLPKVSTVVPEQEPPVQVKISKEGSFFMNDKRILDPQLNEEIRAAFPDPSSGTLLIQADKDVSFDYVVRVMDAARQGGIKKMGVAVLQKSGS
jgi:biopolymer transport protein TolR